LSAGTAASLGNARFSARGYPNSKRQHFKVFATKDAAETWLQENDPEGVAFEYEVLE
jgi:hypothetical protein